MIKLFKKSLRIIPLVKKRHEKVCNSQADSGSGIVNIMTTEEQRDYYIHGFVPEKVRLDFSTVCQLRCAGCFFQKGKSDNLGRGFLSVENFKYFLEMHPFIREIEISNWGEPFLNPNIIDMIQIAKSKGVALTCWNGSNFNTISDELIHALVDYEFRVIVLSIDGACQETYSKYRLGGDFNQVMDNVSKLQAYKKERKSKYPELLWQYVLMEHNELEVEKAKALAQKLDIPIRFKLNWDENYKPVNREYLMKETGLKELTREEYASAHKTAPLDFICEQVFTKPQINWDGRLLGCCDNMNAAFDVNVFEVGLINAIRSPKYSIAKKCLLTVHPDKDHYSACMCYGCKKRLKREQSGIMLEIKQSTH